MRSPLPDQTAVVTGPLCPLSTLPRGCSGAAVELAAATATGVDYGKDLVEKQMFEKLAPRIAQRLAVKLGEETAEKWVGRMIPLASSAIGGILNFSFVRTWGRRVQRNLREKHVAKRTSAARIAAWSFPAPDPNLN